MKKLFSNRRLMLGLGVAVTLLSVGLLGFYFRRLVPQLLIALAIVGITWIAAHFIVRWHRRRKQRGFDAGVAAKEGIEDRKREWSSWTEELDRQGINRYELPFYLLLGEPQSGKSVLLQNSDLHFPFGQTRLSGIGGTRGCDWWFTEEAVILDLAGRLFTHEGGASDALEWEAFLDLLSGYRPLCPANGVMLVIPCDGLMLDPRDDAMHKASRIQEALLTLTSKLQAQLPIYVVLTKGDKIFGFAETVHRLDPAKRHQMFGWSRRSEDFDEPFDMVEVRQAFGDIVERARTLRETMLASLRLPEGISEADRVYAFPDELEALLPNLELYLKRIFSESSLVDRLYFRGMYLTSGLQVGAPIANVCANLLGGQGEADQRDLEALFSKQQAYFIKDLIRRRVFSERGLVRPTKGRVSRAQRNAWIGYGGAALIALGSVIWSVTYAIGDYGESELNAFQKAVLAGAEIANASAPTLEETRFAMRSTWEAKAIEPRSLEGAGVNREQSFANLYGTLSDQRLVPTLREQAERDLQSQLEGEQAPQTSDQLLAALSRATLLLSPIDVVAEARRFDPESAEPEGFLAILNDVDLRSDARTLLLQRGELESDVPASEPERKVGRVQGQLAQTIDWLQSRIDDLLELGTAYQVRGQVGYLLAWEAALEAGDFLRDLEPRTLEPGEFETCRSQMTRLHTAAEYLGTSDAVRDALVAGDEGAGALSSGRIEEELNELETARARFFQAVEGASTEGDSSSGVAPWRRTIEIRAFLAAHVFPGTGGALDRVSELIKDRTCAVPPAGLESVLSPTLVRACDPAMVPADASQPAPLPGLLAQAFSALSELAAPRDPQAERVLVARCFMLQAAYLEAYQDKLSLEQALAGEADLTEPKRLGLLLGHLTALEGALLHETLLETRDLHQPWIEHIHALIESALEEANGQALAQAEELDVDLLQSLKVLSQASDRRRTKQLAESHFDAHLEGVAEGLLSRWTGLPEKGQDTLVLIRELDTFLSQASACLAAPADGALLATAVLTSWFLNVETLVGQRLGVHYDALRRASLLPRVSEVPGSAAAVLDLLAPAAISRWQEDLKGYDLPDLASLPSTTLDSLEDWEPLAGLSLQLREAEGRFRIVDSPRNSERYDFLWDFAEPLREPAKSESGAALAERLQGVRKQHLPFEGSPPQSAAEHYYERLTEFLDSQCVQSLRRSYVSELEVQLNKRSSLQDALYTREPEDLSALAPRSRDVATELADLLDAGGAFAQLQERYRQVGEASLRFRPADGESVEESAEWWAFDAFLRDLRSFLRDGDTTRAVSDSEVSIYLVKPRGAEVWETTWLFSSFDEEEQVSRSVTRRGPLKWSFAADNDRVLLLRWSISSGERQPDDVVVEVGTCLAPLLLCWEYGEAPAGSAQTLWSISVPRTSGFDIEFGLDFNRSIPVRPACPW